MPHLWWCYPLVGAFVGLFAGLLGIGGGLLIVAALVWMLPLQGVPDEAILHVALATSLASIVLTAMSSGAAHQRRGSVLWPSVAWMVPGLLLGGAMGARTAGSLTTDTLRAGVAIFCVLAAIQLWRGGRDRPAPPPSPAPRGPLLATAAVLVGAVSALVGIGGGSLTVPLLIARGARAVHAVGTSSVCGIFIGIASAIGYATLSPPQDLGPSFAGYLFWPGALLLAVSSVLFAPLGARIAHALEGRHLQRLFAVFLLAMGALTWFAPRGGPQDESAVASIEQRAGNRISTASGLIRRAWR